jgi:hypothetical protein
MDLIAQLGPQSIKSVQSDITAQIHQQLQPLVLQELIHSESRKLAQLVQMDFIVQRLQVLQFCVLQDSTLQAQD